MRSLMMQFEWLGISCDFSDEIRGSMFGESIGEDTGYIVHKDGRAFQI